MTAWQPISTAPRDGTAVLFYLAKPIQHSRIHVGYIHPNVTLIAGHFAFDMPAATHWQPLPPPPEEG